MHRLEVSALQKDNEDLKSKVSKLKALNEDYKRSLKEQISSFNQEGEIHKRHKEEVSQFTKQIKEQREKISDL